MAKGKEVDQIFVQNFIIILVMMLGMVAIFVVIARTIGTDEVKIAKQRAMVIAELTKPIGQVKRPAGSGSLAGQTDTVAGEAAIGGDPGKQVYDGLCASCHGSGMPNIPQLGKPEDWKDRIAGGHELLYERAINGFSGASGMVMPAKGGNAALSDDEVRAAVDYMVSASQPGEQAADGGTGSLSGQSATAAGETAISGDPGKQVYEGLCASCHGSGLPNIPQLGKVEDWKDRIAQGHALMYERAINGFTGASGMVMPAKGGNAALTDDQVRAAVDYMVSASQPGEVSP